MHSSKKEIHRIDRTACHSTSNTEQRRWVKDELNGTPITAKKTAHSSLRTNKLHDNWPSDALPGLQMCTLLPEQISTFPPKQAQPTLKSHTSSQGMRLWYQSMRQMTHLTIGRGMRRDAADLHGRALCLCCSCLSLAVPEIVVLLQLKNGGVAKADR